MKKNNECKKIILHYLLTINVVLTCDFKYLTTTEYLPTLKFFKAMVATPFLLVLATYVLPLILKITVPAIALPLLVFKLAEYLIDLAFFLMALFAFRTFLMVIVFLTLYPL